MIRVEEMAARLRLSNTRLHRALRRVWASLWNLGAVEERNRLAREIQQKLFPAAPLPLPGLDVPSFAKAGLRAFVISGNLGLPDGKARYNLPPADDDPTSAWDYDYLRTEVQALAGARQVEPRDGILAWRFPIEDREIGRPDPSRHDRSRRRSV